MLSGRSQMQKTIYYMNMTVFIAMTRTGQSVGQKAD